MRICENVGGIYIYIYWLIMACHTSQLNLSFFVDWTGERHIALFLGLTIQVIHPEILPLFLASKETFGNDDSDESRCFDWSWCNFLAGDVDPNIELETSPGRNMNSYCHKVAVLVSSTLPRMNLHFFRHKSSLYAPWFTHIYYQMCDPSLCVCACVHFDASLQNVEHASSRTSVIFGAKVPQLTWAGSRLMHRFDTTMYGELSRSRFHHLNEEIWKHPSTTNLESTWWIMCHQFADSHLTLGSPGELWEGHTSRWKLGRCTAAEAGKVNTLVKKVFFCWTIFY